MIAPARIAMIGSSAMVVAMLATNVIVQIAGPASRSFSFSETIAAAVAEALGVAFFAWVGMYFGARLAPPNQRNGQLVKLVAIAHGVFGTLLTLPIKTHAVMVDMPSASDASAIQMMPLLIPVALIAGVVLGSLFITRVLAALSEPRIA
jgi:hypothetical protein